MSVSLVGIVGLQVYWITESIHVKEDQFSQLITQSLKSVSNDLETLDKIGFVERYKLSSSGLTLTNDEKDQLLSGVSKGHKNSIADKKMLVLDVDFPKIEFIISKHDSLRQPVFTIKKNNETKIDSKIKSDFLTSLSANDSISAFLLALLDQKYEELGDKMPIRKRVSKDLLEHLLTVSFSQNNIETRFEYAIMSKGLITPVYSKKFKQNGNEYVVPIFANKGGVSVYDLYVQFPNKRDLVLSSMWIMLVLSVIFTLVIVFTYAGALYLIFKHRKTSEVKTDFINNMTHELKTPIATINLAIDALRNPKILGDKERILHYAKVIKDENNRMHQQIENVLRISRLDKNKLELSREETSMNELVEEAINHILIIVEDRGGEIDFDLDAEDDIVNVDVLHFSNILVNILDNANKYTIESPQIHVKTFNLDGAVVVEVTDNGIGINKALQQKIFDKFFRVSKGNIHNVKGQGLGLAYVKQIVEAHGGTVGVRSKKGKGSTFVVTVPLM